MGKKTKKKHSKAKSLIALNKGDKAAGGIVHTKYDPVQAVMTYVAEEEK